MGTAERDQSMPKTAGVKSNRSLDAVSDGAFAARITTCQPNFSRLPLESSSVAGA